MLRFWGVVLKGLVDGLCCNLVYATQRKRALGSILPIWEHQGSLASILSSLGTLGNCSLAILPLLGTIGIPSDPILPPLGTLGIPEWIPRVPILPFFVGFLGVTLCFLSWDP